MDTPLTALRWLLASEDRCDAFLEEIEGLNTERREVVQAFTDKALYNVNPNEPILFFVDTKLEHGLIGLVAGKLTETYNRPSIVLCEHIETDGSLSYVASCRAPEWCNIMELLDQSKALFLRYGGHRQAAGFSILPRLLPSLQENMKRSFLDIYGEHIPAPTITVEAAIPPHEVGIEALDAIAAFRPFGIGNPKPKWLFENVTITEVTPLGQEGKHCKIYIQENPNLPLIFWHGASHQSHFPLGATVSFLVDFESNVWNGKTRLQVIIKDYILNTPHSDTQK